MHHWHGITFDSHMTENFDNEAEEKENKKNGRCSSNNNKTFLSEFVKKITKESFACKNWSGNNWIEMRIMIQNLSDLKQQLEIIEWSGNLENSDEISSCKKVQVVASFMKIRRFRLYEKATNHITYEWQPINKVRISTYLFIYLFRSSCRNPRTVKSDSEHFDWCLFLHLNVTLWLPLHF